MRILCLHGKGTSGDIFKSQTTSFRSRLSDLNAQFDFIDAPYPSTPAAGIDLFYKPPYYSFYQEDTIPAVRSASKWLLDLVAERGPYDAVMCFSQGCVLAASTLLLHAHESPHTPPPFKSAIFICGGAPLTFLESIGYEIPPAVTQRDLASRMKLAAQADSAAILAQGSERWRGDGWEVTDEEAVRRELIGGVKIGLPTVHVYGKKDPRYVAGLQLSGLCVEHQRRVFDHGGGHEIPRGSEVTDALAELVRWALEQV
ncbi:serine hydrolase FSH [Aspergillus coremiiformis]|uniref:Serine hydrolase FSH n=1 Tax=Aspergillus coremiiformis TaxID=138285 RepID=A0A5N6Z6B3_9EURO|nr:serine hydrolase FSH [Aspergillus coremiiformis]